MISRGSKQTIILTVAGIIAVCTIFSCSNDAKISGNKEMIDWIRNEPIKGTGEVNAAKKDRSWYLSDNEQFSLRNGASPGGVLYMGFRDEIKVQLFSEYLSVTFRELNFAFRVYKNCTVEFIE